MSAFDDRPRARVTIVFDYPIAMGYYPSDTVETPSDAAAYDQESYETDSISVEDLLSWSDSEISVSIEAAPEEQS